MIAAFAFWLRLLAQRLRWPSETARAAAALARPAAPLIWLRLGAGTGADTLSGAELVLRRLQHLRPDAAIFVSLPRGAEPTLPKGVQALQTPEDTPAAARLILKAWTPDAVVLFGDDLPAALIDATHRSGVPTMVADMRPIAPARPFARLVNRAALARVDRISVRDAEALAALARLGVPAERIELGGVLAEPAEPLRCSEAERADIAAGLSARPVLFAAAVPESEIAAVLEAYSLAQRHAHRMLLILAPDRSENGEALAEQFEAEGWAVALRTREGEPDETTNIFIADDPAEYGLWYRIAPVTYMGGTLSGAAGRSHSPLEPAALGSAIVHGYQTAPFAAEYARLDNARATRSVFDAHSLGEALADLLAPDRAAILAHNAWVVTSSGAGAAEALARAILAELDQSNLRVEAA